MNSSSFNANPSWCANLVRPSNSGLWVQSATLVHEHEVVQLLLEMMLASTWRGSEVDIPAIRNWAQRVLSSQLWLVLLLRDGRGESCGIAVAEYISYDVDPDHRILRCKHLFVRHWIGQSCLPPSHLLLQALLVAARRSPKVRDVFLVTLGAPRISETGKLFQRIGFRRIGTQHLGGCGRLARSYSALREVHSADELDSTTLSRMHKLGQRFLLESGRASLGTTIDFPRLLAQALAPSEHTTALALLAFDEQKLVGFISGRPAAIALSRRRFLQSSFFYVEPAYRGTPVCTQLFDAFAQKAVDLGLDGAHLGTSSGIEVDRVCRFLQLRGYRHSGDVFSCRVTCRDERTA